MQLIVITGLSGAGKGLATRHFEDFGFFCVDNLPPMLIPSFAELLERGKIGKAALVVDVRGGEFFPDLVRALDDLQKRGFPFQTLFLDCDDEALLKRFSETRRKHPLDDGEGLLLAIERERELLVPLRERADKVINTSRVTPRELRGEIERTFVSGDEATGLLVQVESFGFKHGPHASADLVFDVRFLPNPNYDRDIGHLDGYAQPVIDYVLREQVTQQFLRHWQDFLGFVVPQFQREGKAYLTIAIGCTGGRHRSVALSNWLGAWLESQGFRAKVSHRDLVRGVQNAPPSVLEPPPAPPPAQSQMFAVSLAASNPEKERPDDAPSFRDAGKESGVGSIYGGVANSAVVPANSATSDSNSALNAINSALVVATTEGGIGGKEASARNSDARDERASLATDEDLTWMDDEATPIGEDARQ